MVAASIQWAERISAEHRTVQCRCHTTSEPGKVLDFNGLLHISTPRLFKASVFCAIDERQRSALEAGHG